MRILAVSDEVVDRLYDTAAAGRLARPDLILSCGDLDYKYLEFLVTIFNVPLYYVPGNHDPDDNWMYAASRAEGCFNLDRRTAQVKGLLIAGLGGSIRYRPDGINQYDQGEMYSRMARLLPQLARNRLRHGRALDILIAHSPPFGIHDDDDPAHQGLRALNFLIRWARPRYVLHGHTHIYRRNLIKADTLIGQTKIINVHPYRLLEYDHE
jgi:Icc-related predicted phosphoesterase